MVEPLNHVLHHFAQVLEIQQQTRLVEFPSSQSYPDLVIVPVRVLTLALVIAQVMPGSKRIFNRDFVHETSGAIVMLESFMVCVEQSRWIPQ